MIQKLLIISFLILAPNIIRGMAPIQPELDGNTPILASDTAETSTKPTHSFAQTIAGLKLKMELSENEILIILQHLNNSY